MRMCVFNCSHKFLCSYITKYLQFEGVRIVGAGGEVSVDSGTTTERSSIRRLLVVTVL